MSLKKRSSRVAANLDRIMNLYFSWKTFVCLATKKSQERSLPKFDQLIAILRFMFSAFVESIHNPLSIFANKFIINTTSGRTI